MTLVDRLRALVKDLHDCGLYRRAALLDDLTDEIDGKVLVKPFTVLDVPSERWVAKIDHTYPGRYAASGDNPTEAIAELQALLDRGSSPAPIDASQAGRQPPDEVQVPRAVYHGVLDSLDYLIYILPFGPTRDTVVRERERLKMCDPATEGR